MEKDSKKKPSTCNYKVVIFLLKRLHIHHYIFLKPGFLYHIDKTTVVKIKDNLPTANAYQEHTIKINDIDIPAFKSDNTGLVLEQQHYILVCLYQNLETTRSPQQ